MKKIFLLIILFSLSGFSQSKGKIYFRNGTIFEGKIIIQSRSFGLTEKTEVIYYPEPGFKEAKGFSDIEKVEGISDETNKVTSVFYFKKLKNKEILIERISSNKNFDVFMGYYSVGVSDLVPGFSAITTDLEYYEEFFIGKKYNYKVEKLPRNTRRKKYKNIVLKYTSDCKKFVEKINDGFLSVKKDTRSHFKEYEKICN